jgi:hypothetical protein
MKKLSLPFLKKQVKTISVNQKLKAIEDEADKIKGLDLRLDDSIQRLCDAYKTGSGATRSVIYVLLVLNILSFIAVLNTHKWSWTSTRIQSERGKIITDEKKETKTLFDFQKRNDSLKLLLKHQKQNLLNSYRPNSSINISASKGLDKALELKFDSLNNKYKTDSLQNMHGYLLLKLIDSNQTDVDIYTLNSLDRNRIENTQHISIPFVSNAFDINDLAFVSGISFMVLLYVLKFMLNREKNNLRIAFDAITDRYSNQYDDALMIEATILAKRTEINVDVFKSLLNFKRRRYHYNSLSMNELFNMPKLDVSNNRNRQTRIGKLVKNHFFSFPFIIYLIIFINDLMTFRKGFQVSFHHTVFSYALSLFFLTIIARVCDDCNAQKNKINNHFDEFHDSEYMCDRKSYVRSHDERNQMNIIKRLLFAFFFLGLIVKGLWGMLLNKPENHKSRPLIDPNLGESLIQSK